MIPLSELPATSCEPRQSDATKKSRRSGNRQASGRQAPFKIPPQRGMS